MRALIVGLGSIGRRHLKNLRTLEPDANITVWHQRSRPGEASQGEELADRAVYTLEEALVSRPDAALITSPSSLHMQTALALAEQEIHLFVEKPLSNNLDCVGKLLDLCDSLCLVLMVGYNFRFYPPFQAIRQALMEGRIGRTIGVRAEVGQYLPDWRPGSDYRSSASARNELGGGAVLELSHELDYVRWLVGEVSAVSARLGRLGGMDIDVEDAAEILLEFTGGAIGSIHLDMVQRTPTRTCRIIGTEGTITWDISDHSARMFSATANTWEDLHPPQSLDRNDMYMKELQRFLDCVRRCDAPIVTGEDGKRILEIALAAKESARSGKGINI